MITVPAIIAVIGGIAFLIGLLGGGITVREVELPKLPGWARGLSGLAGLVLMGVAALLPSDGKTTATPMPIAVATTTSTPTLASTVPSPASATNTPGSAFTPTSTLTPLLTATNTPVPVTPTATPEPIRLKFDSPKPGARIKANSQITAEGNYSLLPGIAATDVYIWIVLQDNFRNYYLQNPPVELKKDGRWVAKVIRPGSGITRIVAVQVTQEGNRIFDGKVATNDWGSFRQLPEKSRILDSVDITTEP